MPKRKCSFIDELQKKIPIYRPDPVGIYGRLSAPCAKLAHMILCLIKVPGTSKLDFLIQKRVKKHDMCLKMDELDVSPPHRNRLNTQKKKAEKGNSSGKHGDKTTEAPTAKAAMDTLRKERDKWKARAEFLEEKLSDVTSERDICRTQLSDALASLKGAQQSRREDSDDEAMGGSEMQHDSEDDSEDDSESSSDSSESSDSSPDRKRKKKGKGKGKKSGKKRKNKKEKKA
ncbi:uncharacterized protein LOC126389352 [Epinephelus moara]|uniref:uncharacterized protein LOC126389352 n=1 Tax=Epinephelus moara TaxID=300413 RepID=UPI00214F5200|nr:uncharacterized protein LOC126389352 [Epinephelus moara]